MRTFRRAAGSASEIDVRAIGAEEPRAARSRTEPKEQPLLDPVVASVAPQVGEGAADDRYELGDLDIAANCPSRLRLPEEDAKGGANRVGRLAISAGVRESPR